MNGSLDELRISKGIARWTSNFTPSLTSYTTDTDTKLLLHFNGDQSASEHSITFNGDADMSSTGEFTGSYYFDGSEDYMTIPDNTDFELGTDDFTIDTWVKFNSKASNDIIAGKGSSYWLAYGLTVIGAPSDKISFSTLINGSWIISSSDTNPVLGQWYHIAAVRNSGNLYLYLDGMLEDAQVVGVSSIANTSESFNLGSYSAAPATYSFNGYIDEFRISKGIARWTSNFTRPTEAYSLVTNTAPNLPTLDNYNTGGITTDNTPTLQFDLSDPDSGDLIKYQVQIDNNSDFTSTEVDVTEGSYSATPRSNVTYTPSTLADGQWYWRVKAIDDDTLESAWTTASSGFIVDATAPTLNTKTTFTTDWYTTDQTSTFNYTDATSGIASGNNPTCSISTEGTTSTCTNSSINVCDNAGNCNTTSQTSNSIKLDKSAPTGGNTTSPNASQRDSQITITVNAGADALAGMSTNDSDYLLEVSTATYNGTSCGTFSSFANANVTETATATEYIYTNTNLNTCYKFRYTVQDILGHSAVYTSSATTIVVANGLPNNIVLDNYNDGASTSDTTPSFQFDLPADPDGDLTKYQIQVDNNANFTSPEIDFTELNFSAGARENTTYTTTALTNGHQYWRVRLFDDYGGIGNWVDSTLGFIIDTILPTSKILYPQNNGNLKDVNRVIGNSIDATGVDYTRISILDMTTGYYYNGTDFSASSEEWLMTTAVNDNATQTKWFYEIDQSEWDSGSSYTIRSRATDLAGNEEHTDAITFTYDLINGKTGSIYVSNPAVDNNSDYKVYYPNTAGVPLNGSIEIDFDDTFRFSPWLEDADIALSNQSSTITASSDSIDRVNKKITSTIIAGNVGTNDLIELQVNNLRIHNPSASGSYILPIRIYNSVGGLIESGTGEIILVDSYQQVEVNVNIEQSLQVSVDSGAVLLEVDPDVQLGQNWDGTGGIVTEKTAVTVKTNAQSGYDLMIKLSGYTATGSAVLDGTTNTGNQITSSAGDRVTTENNFAFAVNSGSTATGTNFTSTSANITGAGLGTPTNTHTDDIFYYLNVDYTTPSDVYRGTVTYTAVGQF